MTTLYYFHDPMCSWCWGFRPTWLKLQNSLPETVAVEYVLGGLAPDNDQAMPIRMQAMLKNTWQRIHDELGTEFNFDFWDNNTPRRSTYPACRAVIAANQQGKEQEMIHAIQQAYYLRALNPSDDAVLKQLAAELHLDETRFSHDLNSDESQQSLDRQTKLTKSWMIPGFPSLVLQCQTQLPEKTSAQKKQYPITLNYHSHQAMLERINNVMAGLTKG